MVGLAFIWFLMPCTISLRAFLASCHASSVDVAASTLRGALPAGSGDCIFAMGLGLGLEESESSSVD